MLDLDFREDLGKVSCPVLVLCGERDKANRKAARGLQAGIPGAELAWIPGAGHEANLDAPEALAEVLRAEASRTWPPIRVLVNQAEDETAMEAARRLAECLPWPVYAGALKRRNWTCLS